MIAFKWVMNKEKQELQKEIEKKKIESQKLTDKIKEQEKKLDAKKKDFKDDSEPVRLKSYSVMKYGGWQDKIIRFLKKKLMAHRVVIVNMELANGMHRSFLAIDSDEGFKYRGKKYIFDHESKYFITDAKMYAYDFHENFTLPIKRNIPLNEVKKAIELSNLTEVEYATNPSTLERFLVSKIAEGIMKGASIEDWIKQLKILLIITAISSVIHLLLFMFKTGMFSQIKIPGIS